jgi:hypothetical protein
MRRWVAWSSLLTLLVLTGCTDDSNAPTATITIGGIPVLEGATRPPGTRLANGFTVPRGTALIGDVFPIGAGVPESIAVGAGVDANSQSTLGTRGWRGYLLVHGDPGDVVRHFQREAAQGGLTLQPGSRGNSPAFCGFDSETREYGCGARATLRRGLSTRVFWVSVRRWTRTRYGPAPLSYAVVSYEENKQPVDPVLDNPSTELGPPAPPLPNTWPPLPQPGELVPPDDIKIESASRVVAPAMVDTSCIYHSSLLMLRIDGDPETVIKAYQSQFERLAGERGETRITRHRQDGALVLRGSALGYDARMHITAVVRAGRPVWALLEPCRV